MKPVAVTFAKSDAVQVLRHYGLRLLSLSPLATGPDRLGFAARTDVGPVFLRVTPDQTREDALFEEALLWHLLSHGFRTAALFQAHNRTGHVRVPGAVVMVYEWVRGQQWSNAEITEDQTRQFGQIVGQFHLCVADLPVRKRRLLPLSRLAQRLQARQARLTQAPNGGAQNTSAEDPTAEPDVFAQVLSEIEKLLAEKPLAIPVGMNHGDLFLDRLFFPKSAQWSLAKPWSGFRKAFGASAAVPHQTADAKFGLGTPWLVHFGQAAHGPWLEDLAMALLGCAAPSKHTGQNPTVTTEDAASDTDRCGPFLLRKARALVAGYQHMRLLTESEWAGLHAALRTVCVRGLGAWLLDPACLQLGRQPLEYLAQLGQLSTLDPATLIFALRDR